MKARLRAMEEESKKLQEAQVWSQAVLHLVGAVGICSPCAHCRMGPAHGPAALMDRLTDTDISTGIRRIAKSTQAHCRI